jgi:hypothetical protein
MSNTGDTAKYLLAKYIPDLHRREPRNIGVIVWSPDGVDARFLGEREKEPEVIDGRSVPSFVTSLNAYKQWVHYWRAEIEKPEINPVFGGEPVRKNLPAFTEVLKSANKGNFVLEDGGLLLDKLSSDELSQMVDNLFNVLVETNGQDEAVDLTLDEVCDELLEKATLTVNPHFHNYFTVKCPVAETQETFTFSHAYKNGTLERLYQRVPLPRKRKSAMKKNVHDAAWTFEKVIDAKLITPQKTGALVYVGDEQRADSHVQNALDVLSSVTRVLNLHDRKSVLEEFRQLALLSIS